LAFENTLETWFRSRTCSLEEVRFSGIENNLSLQSVAFGLQGNSSVKKIEFYNCHFQGTATSALQSVFNSSNVRRNLVFNGPMHKNTEGESQRNFISGIVENSKGILSLDVSGLILMTDDPHGHQGHCLNIFR